MTNGQTDRHRDRQTFLGKYYFRLAELAAFFVIRWNSWFVYWNEYFEHGRDGLLDVYNTLVLFE